MFLNLFVSIGSISFHFFDGFLIAIRQYTSLSLSLAKMEGIVFKMKEMMGDLAE